MRLVLRHAHAQTVALLRYPSFSVPTLALPAIFFAFFGLPRADHDANLLLASFCAYAVLSVAFFQFGVGIATERARAWELYLRTLPVTATTRLAGRALAAAAFATASSGVVLAIALPTTSVSLPAGAWLRLALALAAGGVTFVAFGIGLGYVVSPKGALPVANILYLSLAYVGGLWTGPSGVPHAVAALSVALPTRVWANVLWEAADGRPWHARYWGGLLAYFCVFCILAAWGYRRDEGERFR
jgi:ABC-2 type transport system permease protein